MKRTKRKQERNNLPKRIVLIFTHIYLVYANSNDL